MIDKSWLDAISSAGFGAPNGISGDKVFRGVNDEVAVGLDYCKVIILRLKVLIGLQLLTAFESIFAHCDMH